jgi:hypothetical protein
MASRCERERAWMGIDPRCYPANATNCANSDGHASDYDCEWAEDTQQCLPVWTESMCETSYDMIEYTGLPAVIGMVAYVAWMSHSFALVVENGAGRQIDLSSAADSSAI